MQLWQSASDFEFGPVNQMFFKDFLSRALSAQVFSGAEPFMQIWGTFMCYHFKFVPVNQMSF